MSTKVTKLADRKSVKSDTYSELENALRDSFESAPIPDSEILENLQLFITTQNWRRIFFFYEMYQKILEVPGVIMQFGTRWGRELALFEALRTTFEPFNHARRVIGFDTFEGYTAPHAKDGGESVVREGNLATSENYEHYLEQILDIRDRMSVLPHVRKFDLVKGDASIELEKYLKANPHTVISLMHLDMNLYEPTRKCLELARPHLTKGSVVIIDEVNLKTFPGETIALQEVFGLNNIRLKRHALVNPTWPAYFEVE